jgi:hypothetical protein
MDRSGFAGASPPEGVGQSFTACLGGTQIHWNGVTNDEFVTYDYEFVVESTDDETVGNEGLNFGTLKTRYR